MGPLVQTAVKGNVTLAVWARVHNILEGLDTEWDEAAEQCEADHGESPAAQVCAGTYFEIKNKGQFSKSFASTIEWHSVVDIKLDYGGGTYQFQQLLL